jgi:DNA-binding MarR family transcriptional regulator
MREEDQTALAERRGQLAQQMVLLLPGFGRWAGRIRDFETPYGKAGLRQVEALYMLRHRLLDPAVPPATALAENFQIQRSVVTRVLARLESSGYIRRTPDPNDHRAQRIEITETGRLLSDYVEQLYFDEMRQALGEIDADDMASMERCMEILAQISSRLGMTELAARHSASRSG